MGGHLATITSADEQSAVEKLLEKNATRDYNWIGGKKTTGNWTWVTKEKWDYTYWSDGQPNDSGYGTNKYALIQNYSGVEVNYSWDDQGNDGWSDSSTWNSAPYYQRTDHYGFVCEWENADSAEAILISDTTVKLASSSTVYTGDPIEVNVKAQFHGVTLKKGTDYTVSYSNNTKIGVASVTIKGKGNFTGSVRKTFTIVPAKVKSVSLTEDFLCKTVLNRRV